ncbi:hypothetical protein GQ457_09G016940 [Hibiscus cannabinus]
MWEDFPGSRDATAYWRIVPIFPYSVRAQNPRTTLIKGTLKELKKGELGRKEREEKTPPLLSSKQGFCCILGRTASLSSRLHL